LSLNVNNIRTIALVGHNGSGKSTLAEAMLVSAGKIDKVGGVLNYDPLETEKGTTLSTSAVTLKKNDNLVIALDTPGFGDFISDVTTAVFASENVVSVVNAVAGVEVQTERTWRIAEKMEKPTAVFINHMDKDRASFNSTMDNLKDVFEKHIVPIVIPVGEGESFEGLVDLLEMKAYSYSKDGKGTKKAMEIPANLKEEAENLRTSLIEDIVETDEELMEKYLGGEEIDEKTLSKAMRSAYINGEIIPVVCGSATLNIGVETLINSMINSGACPADRKPAKTTLASGDSEFELEPKQDEPFVGYIFKAAVDPFIGKQSFVKILSGSIKGGDSFVNANKGSNEKASHIYHIIGKDQEEVSEAIVGEIISIPKLKESSVGDTLCNSSRKLVVEKLDFPDPMLSKSVHPKSKADIDKISNGLSRLSESDPTFNWEHDPETNDTVISGLGSVHLDVMVERLKRLFKIEVEVGKPKIAYRETIRANAETEYKHKKQSGGHGQYGHVKIRMYPLGRGEGFVFDETIFGGSVPNNYIPSVEKGVREAMKKGALAGYPVVDFKVELYDGSYHDVDSSDMAFQIASRQAFKKAMDLAKPVLLEPVMEVDVFVPEENAGDVMGEISSKRGRPLGMEPGSKGYQVVKAKVPFSEMLDFSSKLSSITSGKGYFTMKFSEYSEVPSNIQEKIIEERKRELEESDK